MILIVPNPIFFCWVFSFSPLIHFTCFHFINFIVIYSCELLLIFRLTTDGQEELYTVLYTVKYIIIIFPIPATEFVCQSQVCSRSSCHVGTFLYPSIVPVMVVPMVGTLKKRFSKQKRIVKPGGTVVKI